jgi:hypothetical protein
VAVSLRGPIKSPGGSLQAGCQVDVVGYDGSMPLPRLTANDQITIHYIPSV